MRRIRCSVKPSLIHPSRSNDALAQRDGVFGAVADPTLMARLEISPGTRLTVGNTTFEIRAALTSEPDKLAGGIGFGPRLLVSEDALRATGLLQPGSLVRWHYRLRLPANDASDAAAKALTAQARAQLAGSRMGYPRAQQCLPATRTQRRTLYAIPHDRWTDSTSGRRSRCRQRRQKSPRPADRHDRDDESARGQRPPYFHDLSDAGSADGASRRASSALRLGQSFRSRFPGCSARSFRCHWLPHCISGNCCWLYSMGY